MSEENANQPAATPTETPAASELQPGAQPQAAQAPADGDAQQAEGQAQPAEQPQEQPVESEEQKDKKRERFDRRFSDLSKQAREAREEAAYWRGVAEAARRGGQAEPEPAQAAPAELVAPNPKDFPQGEYDPKYVAALAKHELRLEQRAEAEAAAKREAEKAAREAFQAGAQRLRQTLDKAEEAADGAQGQYFANAPLVLREAARTLPPAVVDLITEAENPIHVAELIGRGGLKDDPLDLGKLKSLSPAQAARKIAKLDAFVTLRLQAQAQPPKPATPPAPPPAPQPSPAPIPTVTPTGAAPSIDPNKGSMDDYVRWRNGSA